MHNRKPYWPAACASAGAVAIIGFIQLFGSAVPRSLYGWLCFALITCFTVAVVLFYRAIAHNGNAPLHNKNKRGGTHASRQ